MSILQFNEYDVFTDENEKSWVTFFIYLCSLKFSVKRLKHIFVVYKSVFCRQKIVNNDFSLEIDFDIYYQFLQCSRKYLKLWKYIRSDLGT